MIASQLSGINRRLNAAIKHYAEAPGCDRWQTPRESQTLGIGDCEDIAISKMISLEENGIPAELCYCTWTDRASKTHPHMVCIVGTLVLDNLIDEVMPMAERHDLHPIYAISHRGLRVWGHIRMLPSTQHSAFTDLLKRIQRGE